MQVKCALMNFLTDSRTEIWSESSSSEERAKETLNESFEFGTRSFRVSEIFVEDLESRSTVLRSKTCLPVSSEIESWSPPLTSSKIWNSLKLKMFCFSFALHNLHLFSNHSNQNSFNNRFNLMGNRTCYVTLQFYFRAYFQIEYLIKFSIQFCF